MSIFSDWQLYNKDVTSPQSFVDFGLYYLIAASLQRRVWTGPAHRPLYSNIYVILVGEPGLGKGLVITPVTKALKYHKLKIAGEEEQIQKDTNLKEVSPALIEALNHANYAKANEEKPHMRRMQSQEKLVIPVAADSTTFRALLQDIAHSTRYINYKKWDPELQKNKVDIYIHASLAFSLEEISSLFAKQTEDVVNCLLKTFDCGDYTRKTSTQGEDHIRNCCLNLFGGTTPGFMKDCFNSKLINEGFSSRTWFIFEYENRSYDLMLPDLTIEQEAAWERIIKHVGRLSKLYGQVKFSDEAWSYLTHWWKHIHPVTKPNPSLKLIPYYSRKNMHAQKMAMILYWMEMDFERLGVDWEDPAKWPPITLDQTKRAMDILDGRERKMHYALNFDNRNPLTAVGRKVIQYITNAGEPQTWHRLLLEFEDDCRDHELSEVMEHLRATFKVVPVDKQNGDKGTVTAFEITNRRELLEQKAAVAAMRDLEVPDTIDSEPSDS